MKILLFFELCRFPKRRYEEISSRVLAFFFKTSEVHNLKDLFIKSMIELLNEIDYSTSSPIDYKSRDWDDIKVLTEANADGKRLDLLIHNNNVVIGIENKITAGLYNPLEHYSNLIETKIQGAVVKKVILSIFDIGINNIANEDNELYGFINITYQQFFLKIKSNIGNYLIGANPKYLAFLTDFIKELENMNNQTEIELKNFLIANKQSIEDLIKAHQKLKVEQGEEIYNRLAIISGSLEQKTNQKWWIYQHYDLGVNDLIKGLPNLGIEGQFKSDGINPFETFEIFLSTWSKSYNQISKAMQIALPHCKFTEENINYSYCLITTLNNPTNDEIEQELITQLNFVLKFLNTNFVPDK
jgi:hypothetical protein